MAQPEGIKINRSLPDSAPAWLSDPSVRDILAVLNPKTQNGSEQKSTTRFVGGCVRDWLMQREEGYDLDLATEWTPDQAIKWLQDQGFTILPTGLKHGTITVLTKKQDQNHNRNPTAKKYVLEVTTLRRDVATHGRQATVAWSDDWAVDAARRDFTINAVYMDGQGEIFDPLGGIADIYAGNIRFIGDASQRLAEDYLRLMRFFRFLAWFGRVPPAESEILACRDGLDALRRHVAVERQWSEIKKSLAAPDPAPTLALMAEYGILPQILPELSPNALNDLSALSQTEQSQICKANNLRRLAAMMPPDQAPILAQRLKLSLQERHYLCQVTDLAQNWRQKTRDSGDFYAALRKFGKNLLFDAALIAASRGASVADAHWEVLRNWTGRDLPITGDDLKALGLSEGPKLGKILKNLTRWWENGGCQADRDQCLAQLQLVLQATGRITPPPHQ